MKLLTESKKFRVPSILSETFKKPRVKGHPTVFQL